MLDKNGMKINKTLLKIYVLSSLIYFAQGIEGLPGLAFFLFLKEKLGFTAEKVMFIGSITGLAWVVKPLWGYLCDNYLSKKKWIILSLLGSIGISLFFGLSPLIPLGVIILMLSLGGANAAIRDVAVDGIMCVDGKANDNCDKIQAIQWTSITIASILVGLGGGYIAQHFTYKMGYLCLIPIYLIIIGVVLKYKPSNKPKESCETCNYQYCCDFSDNKWCQSYERVKPKFLEQILSYKELFTDKKFLFACLFLFLYKYSPSFGTPLSYIERDTFKWSAQFMGMLGAIVSCFEIVGSIIFFKICKKVKIKKWLYISVFLGAITSLCYLYFTPVTAVVYGIAFAVLGMFIHLIVMSFMAKSTIPGKEATSFALLCSISNLAAGSASSLTGAFLLPKIGLHPLIILSAITSFICLPLIKKLEIE
jgi:predicted MFS family arabinose efflux permease